MYLTDLITNGTNPTSLTSWLALNATIEQQDGVSGIRLTSGGYVKQTIAFDTYKINTETFLTSLQVIVPYDLSTDKCKAKAVLSITYTDGKIDTYNYYFTNNNKNATQNTLFETIATVDRPLEVNSITFMVQAETLLETDLCFIKAIKLFPSEEGVQEGVPYYGVKITKEQGLQVERSDKASKVILNSDEFTFYKGDVRKLYFDAVSGEYVFDGTLQIGGTDISGKLTQITSEGIYTGKVSANQIQMSEVDGFISFDDLTDKPTYTAADVGARPYDWNPQYTDILGTKPPTDADNTSSFVGSRLSYIDSYGAYFGIISANQINGGIITGITIQTGYSGKRLVLSGDEFYGTDDNGYKRISISQSANNSYNYALQFRDAQNDLCGEIFANENDLYIRNDLGYVNIQAAIYGHLLGVWNYGGSEIATMADIPSSNPNIASYGDFIYFTTTSTNVALYKSGDGTPYLSIGSNGQLYVHGYDHGTS